MAPFERGQALVIGVGQYEDSRWDVPTARRDAEELHRVLTDPNLGGYGRGRAELLLDAQATRIGVLDALRRLANRCNEDSVAVISFTGHGAMGEGEGELYYLATSDARFTAPPKERVVRKTGLSVADLARALRDIPARQLLLVVNACSSGHLAARLRRDAIAPDEPAAGQMLPNDAADQILASGQGRAVITASKPEQRSFFQPDERHSYFGQALIDALKGGATSAGRGYVGLYELYEDVHRQVSGVTAQRLGSPQEPVLTLVQHSGPFPLARYPKAISDDMTISQRPPAQLPVRVVERDVIQAIGQAATAIKAEPGSRVTVDNSRRGVNFSHAHVEGNISIGDTAGEGIIKGGTININIGIPRTSSDPLRDLPELRERVAAARNVDEDARDEAAGKLDLAYKSLGRGDSAKARQRVEEALALLRPMDNGYVRSVVRKIEAVRDAL